MMNFNFINRGETFEGEIYYELEYLDVILKYIYKSTNNRATTDDILSEIGNEFHESTGRDIESTLVLVTDDKHRAALRYLCEENLLMHSKGEYGISFKGIIKISSDGFKGEYIRRQRKNCSEVFNNFISPIIAFLSLLVLVLSILFSL